MSSTVTSTARFATMDDVPGVARVLSRSCYDDPLLRWLFPDDDLRMARTRRFFALVSGFGYVPAGETRVTTMSDGPEDSPTIRAAALWAPPASNPEGQLVALRAWPHWVSLVGRANLGSFVRVFAEWKLAAPQEPHLYLAALGVDPAVEGQGIAGSLLTAELDRADSESLPVFTQTLNDKCVGFYERFGFDVVREVEHPGVGTTTFLRRDPA
ncbi:N-acetyltransferase [Nocardiopsis sp. YSL2]|uniref:GNAT family N-acetyltransferase n=1 Tax=Nocardiopsis sp. YSL2 TaxID=2939492 RepID=UPI0026F47365|nr:GNAT family N-acetyltransferase [Nocardiopsis sp. YSL2]